jgi:hypothetical protein
MHGPRTARLNGKWDGRAGLDLRRRRWSFVAAGDARGSDRARKNEEFLDFCFDTGSDCWLDMAQFVQRVSPKLSPLIAREGHR